MTNPIRFPSIPHGGDYNPEQWPEELWDDDIRLMRKAHWNIVTLPVFGWVSLQPEEDRYDFTWLDRIIDKLSSNGIHLCLATATASTPAWLDRKYPDTLRTDISGVKLKHGNRHTFCPNSPNFRRLSVEMARQLAQRYGKHPFLSIWHVSNEYGSHCYCDECGAAFGTWLQKRYGSLEVLNARWYTRFWGHTYTDWEEIETPTKNGERSNQAILIDYDRFQSESLLNCYRAERDVLQEFSPGIPITTNLMGSFKALNYHQWAKEMDIISWDSYPRKGAKPSEIAFQHSLMRGLKEGKPWMLMEQTPSQQNWQSHNSLKRPGVMRLWSYQAMAHGADAIMYFQWRRGQGGCEKFHGAVVAHSGRSDTRVFNEVASLGAEMQRLKTQTLGGKVQAEVAILFDWENWWALEYSSGPSVDLKYVPQIQAYYDTLHKIGITTDVISPDAEFESYKLIVAPVLYMLKEAVAEKLTDFVNKGGVLVSTYFSGIVNENDLVHLGGYPGPLKELLGIWVEETDVLSPQDENFVLFEDEFDSNKRAYAVSLLCDRIHPESAQVIAVYQKDFYANEAAITVNRWGDGKAYYLGTMLQREGLESFFNDLVQDIGIHPPFGMRPPDGVEIIMRESPRGSRCYYVLNHNSEAVTICLPCGKYRDILSDIVIDESESIGAYGVWILESVT